MEFQWIGIKEQLIKYSAEIAFYNIKESVILMKKKFIVGCSIVLQEYMKVSGLTADHIIEARKKDIFVIQHELGKYRLLFSKELFHIIFSNSLT